MSPVASARRHNATSSADGCTSSPIARPRHAAHAHAEQRLGGRVHLRDQQSLVEHDESGREALEYLAGVGRRPRSAQSADRVGRRRARNVRGCGDYGFGFGCGLFGLFGLFGFWMLDCWTMNVVASERITSAPL